MTAEVHGPLSAELFQFLDLQVDAINFDDLANRIVRRFADVVDAEICTLWRRVSRDGEDRLELNASVGFEVEPGENIPTYKLNWNAGHNREIDGVTAWIAIRNQTCAARSYDDLVSNAAQPWHGAHRGRWDGLQFMAGAPQISFRSLLGVPLRYGNATIGVLKAENCRHAGGFSEREITLAEDVSQVLALMLESMNRREQYVQIRQRALYELSSVLPTLELPKFYQKVVDMIAELVKADLCSLWLVEEDTLTLAANFGIRQSTTVPIYEMNRTVTDEEIEGLTAWVAIRQKRIFVTKYEELTKYKAHRGKWDSAQWSGRPQERFGCLYAVPLLAGDQTIGVLKIENSRGKQVFGNVEIITFDIMAGFIALATELNRRLRFDIVVDDFLHNLQSPVTTAVSALSLIREELTRPEIRRDILERRLANVGRAVASIYGWTRNLYTIATVPKFGSGPVAHVELRTLLEKVRAQIALLRPDFAYMAEVGNLSMRLTPAQEKALEVIFFNLFDNSHKYSKPPRDIRVAARADDESIVVVVSDKGCGIPEADLPNVFRRGFRGANVQSDQGIGVGLSTVQRLLEELHGEIHPESSGSGTRMVLRIPAGRNS